MTALKTAPPSPRERILKTATTLFNARGIKSTGVDTIIAESGVAKMTFYKHFPSKQTLVMEVLKQGERDWVEWFMKRIEARSAKGEDNLLAIFSVLEEWFNDPSFRGCPFINATAEAGDHGTEECQFSSEYKRKVAKRIEELASARGYKSAKTLAEQFLLLIDGSIVRAQMEGTAKSAKLAQGIAKILLGE